MFPLRTMLRHHLEHNHYPPAYLSDRLLDRVMVAIERVRTDEATDNDRAIVERFHLDDPAFLNPSSIDEVK